MDKQCMCGNPDCDGCESITLFRGYEAEYVEGLKAELARKDALLEKMGGLLKEVLKFNQYWFEEYPGNLLTQPTAHSLEHLTIKIKALLAEMEGKE